jgi:dihydrofolate reductase
MAAYWPTADSDPSIPDYLAEFASIWRDKPKVVFSNTLDKVEWNSRLATGTIPEEIAKLKEQPDNDMELGGPNLAATFMQLGLIDEYRLFVQPVILGAGTPFFPPFDNKRDLLLVETKTFESGVVYLRYESR